MFYSLGSQEDFKDAPERAMVRLKHDDGRHFYATNRALGADFWYIDGQKISKSHTGMSSAIYHRTQVVARRSQGEPKSNWGSVPGLQKAEPKKEIPLAQIQVHEEKVREEAKAKRRRYKSGTAQCARHNAEYATTYGCKECRREQRAHKVAETAQPLAPDHVWGEIKSSNPETITVCQTHGVSHDVKGECYKCVQEATPAVEEIRKVEKVTCIDHNVLHAADEACPMCATVPAAAQQDEREVLPEVSRIGQVGGTHYDDMPIDVFQFCEENGMGFVLSSAVKYLARKKGESRIEDLKKAINCIERQIKFEETGSWER